MADLLNLVFDFPTNLAFPLSVGSYDLGAGTFGPVLTAGGPVNDGGGAASTTWVGVMSDGATRVILYIEGTGPPPNLFVSVVKWNPVSGWTASVPVSDHIPQQTYLLAALIDPSDVLHAVYCNWPPFAGGIAKWYYRQVNLLTMAMTAPQLMISSAMSFSRFAAGQPCIVGSDILVPYSRPTDLTPGAEISGPACWRIHPYTAPIPVITSEDAGPQILHGPGYGSISMAVNDGTAVVVWTEHDPLWGALSKFKASVNSGAGWGAAAVLHDEILNPTRLGWNFYVAGRGIAIAYLPSVSDFCILLCPQFEEIGPPWGRCNSFVFTRLNPPGVPWIDTGLDFVAPDNAGWQVGGAGGLHSGPMANGGLWEYGAKYYTVCYTSFPPYPGPGGPYEAVTILSSADGGATWVVEDAAHRYWYDDFAASVLMAPPPPPPARRLGAKGRTLATNCPKSHEDDCLNELAARWLKVQWCKLRDRDLYCFGLSALGFPDEMPEQSQGFNRQGSVLTPVPAAGDVEVFRWQVPFGYDAVLMGWFHTHVGAGFHEGSGDILWRIQLAGRWLKDMGRVNHTMGDWRHLWPVDGELVLKSGNLFRYIVNVPNISGLIPVGVSRIVCGVRGFLTPSWR